MELRYQYTALANKVCSVIKKNYNVKERRECVQRMWERKTNMKVFLATKLFWVWCMAHIILQHEFNTSVNDYQIYKIFTKNSNEKHINMQIYTQRDRERDRVRERDVHRKKGRISTK